RRPPMRAAIKPHQYSMRARLWANARGPHHRRRITESKSRRGGRPDAVVSKPSFKRRREYRSEEVSKSGLSLERGNIVTEATAQAQAKGPGIIRAPSSERLMRSPRRSVRTCGSHSFDTWSK